MSNFTYYGADLFVDININIPPDLFIPGPYGPFMVDIFESNADGDLTTYLTSAYISDFSGTAVIPGFSYTTGNRLAATLTSLGGDGSTRVGTSDAEYFNFSAGTPSILPCTNCSSFKPVKGEKYWMSAWVKVNNPNQSQVITYENSIDGPALELTAFNTSGLSTNYAFMPSGAIIDGWQRIVGELDIPGSSESIMLRLKADNFGETYFDDIRIHPFNASMKSYVYDGETFWLTSELDDNNYATFYEYDNEGGLVRVKKETSRGVVTIQETRSHTSIDD